MKYLHI